MAFRSTAAELNRQYQQNRNDIEALHDLLEETNKEVTETKVKIDDLKTEVGGLTIRVDRLETKVDQLDTKVDRLGSRFDHVDERFDRLEQLIALPPKEHDETQNPMRTQQEKKISLLETKMDVYNRRTSEHIDELARHNRIFDAHDQRFDALGSQMAEVLGILRGKSA